MARVWNFSAGPAVLPEEVLRQAAGEMLDWHGCGQSVMEMSHRGEHFMEIHAQAVADLRELLAIPDNYKVLFLQGGGTLQFAMVPCNLLRGKGRAAYVQTGVWSEKAIREARLFCDVSVVSSSEDRRHTYVPPQSTWQQFDDAAYLYYCSNETINGVEFNWVPDAGDIPLVADMSSHILSRPIDVSRYGLIYAGAQKNIGPAGLTIVIVREDLIGHAVPTPPTMLDYRQMADHDSMLNTPPTYGIYVAGLVFKWLKRQGGVAAMSQRSLAKSRLLYDAIDASGLYANPVAKPDRSRMNVPFTLRDPSLDARFLAGAEEAGLVQLKGHRMVGGMRASIYNAMPIEGVAALVEYMQDFERRYG